MVSQRTEFASAERIPHEEIQRQSRLFRDVDLLRELLGAVPEILLVLNHERQTVFANQRLLDHLGLSSDEPVLGLRPGEILNCVHSDDVEAGCGTSEFCSTCGAVRAILTSHQGTQQVHECRVLTRPNGEAMDLRVWATPISVGTETFTALAIVDISSEKRRRVLERLFFHDIMNTAGGLRGLTTLMADSTPEETAEFRQHLSFLADELIEEIQAQRELAAAENNELVVHPETVDSLALLDEVRGLYHGHEITQGKKVIVDPASPRITFTSDRVILRRVLANMLKNALEASRPGDAVTLGCTRRDGYLVFQVHNHGAMPREVQLQVFMRSFSTKGDGRGLGTYSVKLLTERYLKGRVSFTSTPEQGTTFMAVISLD